MLLCWYFTRFMFTYSCLMKGHVTFFDRKKLLLVSCILWCQFVKWSLIIFQRKNLWCFFLRSILTLYLTAFINIIPRNLIHTNNVSYIFIHQLENILYAENVFPTWVKKYLGRGANPDSWYYKVNVLPNKLDRLLVDISHSNFSGYLVFHVDNSTE